MLILISTCIDYWAGIRMQHSKTKKQRKLFLTLSLIGNLGMLFFFKYLTFFNEVFRDLFKGIGLEYDVPAFDILLPVGISFYTFQTLSYTIDVYREKRDAEKHFGIFALYVSFFPQLVAGPIERSTHLLPQFHQVVDRNFQRIVDGGKLVLWGLFKKIVVADNMSLFVNNVYGNPEAYSGNMLVVASYGFACIVIYFDFSAYSDIAIGSARALGFDVMDNFKRPLFAQNMNEFWQRWHISLTQWINDYMFKPLMKKTKRALFRQVNIVILFVAIGVWHGAGWTFIFWGLLHALFILVFRNTKKFRKVFAQKTGLAKFPRLLKNLNIAFTLTLWSSSAFFFRGESITDSWYFITHIFDGGAVLPYIANMTNFGLFNIIAIAFGATLVLLFERLNEDMRNPFHFIASTRLRWSLYMMMILAIGLFNSSVIQEYYYFQF